MESSLNRLKYSFLSVVAGAVILTLFYFEIFPRNTLINTISVILMLAGALFYYIYLAIVAGKAGKNVFVWLSLTVITFPWGILISYLMIKDAKEKQM